MLSDRIEARMVRLAQRAVDVHGAECQRQMVIEECAELIVAIRHFERGRASETEVALELADVMIVCKQLKAILGDELVESAIAWRLDRLERALDAPSLPPRAGLPDVGFDANGSEVA